MYFLKSLVIRSGLGFPGSVLLENRGSSFSETNDPASLLRCAALLELPSFLLLRVKCFFFFKGVVLTEGFRSALQYGKTSTLSRKFHGYS